MKARQRKFVWPFVMFFLFISVNLVFAQKALTLADCQQLALEHNKQVLIAREKMEQAQAIKNEAFSSYWPEVFATGSYNYNHKLTTINFGGMDIKLGTKESWSGRLTLQQPLYAGGRIWQANRQAGLGQDLARLDYEKQKDEIMFAVKQGFYAVLLSRHLVDISQEAYEVAQAHLKVSQALYNEGKLSGYEVSRAKVQATNQKTDLLKAKNNLQITIDALFNVLGWTPSLETEFTGQIGFVEKPLKDYEAGLAQALSKRLEIRQALLQEEVSDSSVVLAQSGYLPTLFLISNFARQNASGFGSVNEWTNTWTSSISLNIPLFEGFVTRAKILGAKSQRKQVALAKTQLVEAIKIEVKQVYFIFEQAKENVSGQGENVDAAKDNLKIAQQRYALGLMSDIEVRDAQLALTQAEINYYQAIYDYLLAEAKLEKAIGETL